ncbi:glycosyltransferase family 2 protein [Campylobacter sp. 2018MI35]|uniref:glycosyltransferase family 2 protein n=1 Tax=Campylobacter molothri TaxID=1032242 RepID=UPI001902DABE|nr:glycosyltransferase family 2 protein [Campylobacter sp. 2018MI35]MBZ7930556.1 glycosyltransferase family 2 protein [Campylobacter sp. W0067]MBZ7944331.1 glycosyltransferase family 2 protein [Campylobacter sp. RM13744]MBZ7947208.1 glycosyltransferase family 2 protein [Campylobacter sp. RM10536]MBZ7953140.1 glycosyltransferase family 2 protein [Campylobacter sp. RM9939]MBZ7957520.1 glycosyltransferase family 2 protein [Campylobacter sp. RM10541]MBZ7963344.1 glycosyltransferase family 2 prote
MKAVGVVIPIYNVERYLKKCLDSVINQTYKNLYIVLVNDGSTDNSLNIAKKYVLKDKRVILFDKKNKGQSEARNVGIDYFSGKYKFKNTKAHCKQQLIELTLEGYNPYEIYFAFKNNKSFLEKKSFPFIDYIIFLDSDDFWSFNCIEECISRTNNSVDIIWFKSEAVFENNFKKKWTCLLDFYKYQEQIITPIDWLKKSIKYDINSFYFIWSGMINFNYLKKIDLKFINNIIHEDHHFGMLLFFQSSSIYILPKTLHYYRIRNNSTINISHNFNPPSYLTNLYNSFNKDIITMKKYYSAASMFFVFINISNFLKSKDDNFVFLVKKAFFRNLFENTFKIFFIQLDPWKIKDKLTLLLNNNNNFWKILKYKRIFFLYKYIYKIMRLLKQNFKFFC